MAIILLLLAGAAIGAVWRDRTMVQNFKRFGDAEAWTGEIKK